MTQSGTLYRLPTLGRHTYGNGSGLWPTPLSIRQNDSDNTAGKYYPNKRQFDLAAAVHMWPTPRANDAEKRGNIAYTKRSGLPAAVLYPTPTSRDYRSSMALETVDRRAQESSRGVNLSEFLQRHERNTGSLNPTWVEWLMGYPTGHTVLEASETPSSRKSRKSSAGQSCKPKKPVPTEPERTAK